MARHVNCSRLAASWRTVQVSRMERSLGEKITYGLPTLAYCIGTRRFVFINNIGRNWYISAFKHWTLDRKNHDESTKYADNIQLTVTII